MGSKRMAVVLVVMLMVLVCAPPVAAQDFTPVVPSLPALLVKMVRGVVTGAVIAFLFERMDWFQQLGAKAKWWIVFSVTILLPVLAQAALDFVPAATWVTIEPYWQALGYGFVAWASTQATHILDKLGIRLSGASALKIL